MLLQMSNRDEIREWTMDMEISWFVYSINVGLEGEGVVFDNAQIFSRGRGVNFHIANLDGVLGVDLRNSEWMGRNLVLLLLSLSEFRGIHHWISEMHASSAAREVL